MVKSASPRGSSEQAETAAQVAGRRDARRRRLLAADRRAVIVATAPLSVFALLSLAGLVPDGVEEATRPLWFLYPLIALNIGGLWLYDTFNAPARARRARVAARKRTSASSASSASPALATSPGTAGSVAVLTPVTGRWEAINSPADKVPSHGTDGHAQTYAIDITAAPEGAPPRRFGWWPPTRPATAFPAFGAPVLACADATVVRVLDRRRDHRSRDSYPALAFLLLDGIARETAGVSWLLGNHVILRLDGNGVDAAPAYALYAHLQRGSVAVAEGDTVRAGERIGGCGNSGNSSEPHLHFQLMDHPDTELAAGVPFTWRGLGVPAAGKPWEAPAHPDAPPGRPTVPPRR